MTASRTNRNFRKDAFTLVEIMIVVGIIGILAVMALPSAAKARDNARLNAIYHNLRELQSAKEQWALANNKANGEVVADVNVLQDYLRGGKIVDVISETYEPGPVGAVPNALVPVAIGPYAAGESIPAP